MIDSTIRDKQEKNGGHSKFLPFEFTRALLIFTVLPGGQRPIAKVFTIKGYTCLAYEELSSLGYDKELLL